jgi:uncharacterized repeat protein (TIGR03803 family)
MLYGTTFAGGGCLSGTVFAVNTNGTGLTTLVDFGCYNGDYPYGLVLVSNTLFGTTRDISSNPSYGEIYSVNTDGSGFAVPKIFNGTDGARPINGGMVLDSNTLYGTTFGGGTNGSGTVYAINTDGTGYTVLKNFIGSDGANPSARLFLNNDTLYGATGSGGISNNGVIFTINTDGSNYGVLKNFLGTDGASPNELLLIGNTLYGTTSAGGSLGVGTVFKLDLPTLLLFSQTSNQMVLTWANTNFSLQSAPAVTGGYMNIPGATSPFTNPIISTQQFFRLIGN